MSEHTVSTYFKPPRQTPSVEGYFRVPPIWIDQEPNPETTESFSQQIYHEVVLEKTLDSNITVQSLRDGTFLFDFSSYPFTPPVTIPGYPYPGPGTPFQPPSEASAAEESAEKNTEIRASIINVHQVCLTTSERLLKNRFAQMGFPIDAQETQKGRSFSEAAHYGGGHGDIHSLTRNIANKIYVNSPDTPYPRRVVELDVVKKSLQLLDEILLRDDPSVLYMITSLHSAARSYTGRKYGESVVVAWSVCEQMISSAWNAILDDEQLSERMPSPRRKKLNGRDYTASVITEFLEIMNVIDHETYNQLNAVRKSRNDWAHQLKEPTAQHVHVAIDSAQRLLSKFKGVDILLSLTGPGPGVPSWFIYQDPP